MEDQYIPDILEDEENADVLAEYRRGFAAHGVPYGAYVEHTGDTDIDYYEESYLTVLLPWLEKAKPSDILAFWEGHDEHGETYRVYADYVNDTDVNSYVEAFRGIWESAEDFAMQEGPEFLKVRPEALAYIDPEKLLRDLRFDLYFADVAKGVAVYSSR